MRIPLDRTSPTPLNRQIESYLRAAITTGTLPPATRLPATRRLARDLGVSRLTIETAYANLRADGLIASRLGSGSYVQAPVQPPPPSAATSPGAAPPPAWQQRAEGKAGVFYSTGITGELATGEAAAAAGERQPDLIDLSTGAGDPRLFPADALRRGIQAVLRRDGAAALDYADPWGYPPLRRTIGGLLASDGIRVDPDEILVTSGSQQAIALSVAALAGPGDTVLVERPTYSGALHLLRTLGLRVTSVPLDASGMVTDRLPDALRRYRPKLIYTMPTFHNPAGRLMANDRRAALLATAAQAGVPVLEDDYIGDLRYEGQGQPSLKALDREGTVIYTGTFSKMLMPGFRVGFVTARGPLAPRLAALKSATDLATSNVMQRVLDSFVTIGRYQDHLERSRRVYRRRRAAAARAIRAHLPGAEFDLPRGGLFIWLRLPAGVAAPDLLAPARAAGMAFMPGTRFFPDPADGRAYLRLNFAAQGPEELTEGIRRLGEAVDAAELEA